MLRVQGVDWKVENSIRKVLYKLELFKKRTRRNKDRIKKED